MHFKVIKNTALLFVIVAISCSNKMKNNSGLTETNSYSKQRDSTIIVGANRTDLYLPIIEGKRIGIVANQTSVIFHKDEDSVFWVDPETNETGFEKTILSYTHLVDSLLSLEIDVKKVFTPEHGFRGTSDAGELVKDGLDTKTGLPIFSLHGKHKKPTYSQLIDLDLLIFDIQDVGVRFYTYISTLHYIMEACAENGIPVLILDRPNPNGNYVDGPVLEKEHSSFLGMHPIPLIHGMTIGEYAQMINGEGWLANGITCDIKVINIKNYSHDSAYSLPIRPSPNLPNDHAIKLYPSLGLFEGTTINAGRGTEFQFQRYGAPNLDSNHYQFSYTPISNFGAKYPKHKGKICYGKDLAHVKADRLFSLEYIMDAYNNSMDKTKFFVTDNFTKHAGTEKLQKQIESGISEAKIKSTWKQGLKKYKKKRSRYLIYD